jgi:release factor glutamine methyltransferase
MSTTVAEALREACCRLAQGRIPEPRAAAEILLADVCAVPRSTLYLHARRSLNAHQYRAYAGRIKRRLAGEPVQYITGRQEFWSLEFVVNPHVLIPRPESELLVEHGVRLVRQEWGMASREPLSLLDVGTGSGNLAISLAHTLPQSRVWGIDIALEALRVAQWNAQRLAVADRVTWVCGDLVTSLQGGGRRFVLCVSNLPYVTTTEWQQLPREIKAHEPRQALLGGSDGLYVIRRLIAAIPALLVSGGSLLLEVGWRQAAVVVDLMRQGGLFRDVGIYQDFAGIDRIVWARMP